MHFNPLPIIIALTGAYMLVKLRFFFIIHPIRAVRAIRRGMRGNGAFSSLCLALAGTLGVGNVLGVCVGLSVGGAGAVFWMLVSSVFASALKYSEVSLSASYKTGEREGTMVEVVGQSWGKMSGKVKWVYSFSLLLLSLVMGAALQSNAVTGAFVEICDTPPYIVGVFLALITLLSVIGGVKIIEKITVVAIPVTTIIYIILTLSVVIINNASIPRVLGAIWKGAFSPEGAAGGIIGFLTGGAVKEGFCRGILSNEAGAGTSTVAHGRTGASSASVLGLMGVVEVVFDTVILCSLTALAVLSSLPSLEGGGDGMSLIMLAISGTLGEGFGPLLLGVVFLFAYSTVICWYFYGAESCTRLFGRRACRVFMPFYVAFVFLGAVTGAAGLISVTDLLMLILCSVCCLTLLKNSDRITTLSEL